MVSKPENSSFRRSKEWSHSTTHLIKVAVEAALGRRSKLDIYGTDYPTPDGTCIRDYIHVSDLASAHLLVLDALREKDKLIYNLGNGHGFSVREVIETVRRVTGHPIPVREVARRPGDPAVLVASSAKIKRELRWEPQFPSLEDIVRSAWDWCRAHPDGYSVSAASR
jgi:UDP-glucose 4-epimerase